MQNPVAKHQISRVMASNDVPCCEPMFWIYLVICVALVCFAGIMSGLTLGLMSLSLVDLEVLIKAGQPQDRKNAEKILPVVKNQHLLLCTLLIGNALAMEALPIFIDALLPAWGAILISVTLILAFGEIIPQAVCSRYGLSVGAKLSFLVRLIVIVLFPLAYPISKLLDWVLGKKHSVLLRRAELKTLIDMHGIEAGKGGELTHDETTIITGALDMTQKTARDAMTPLSKIFSLDINSKLDEKTMEMIVSKGHSRIPISSGNPAHIIGLILVKNLIKFSPEDETPLKEMSIRKVPRVYGNLPLYDILNQFQIGHSHMAVVVKCTNGDNDTAVERKSITNTIPNPKQRNEDMKVYSEIIYPPGQIEKLNICIHSPSLYCTDTEVESRNPKATADQGDYLNQKLQLRSAYQDQNLSIDNLKSLSALDEEVIGIITLEDVIEELLQEEILDETDECVDVHNKIKINMLPSRRSPLMSPVAASPSHIQWRTPVASPVSSYHRSPLSSCNRSPILRSPIPPYVRSPLIRPTLSASPVVHCSPSSTHVSGKSYVKMRRPENF